MDASTELFVAVGVVMILGTAALRNGASNALEAVGLMLLLVGLKIARAGIRTLSATLKMFLR